MSTLTPDDVAADLRIGRDSVMRKVRAGVIPAFRVGRWWRIDAATYEAWKQTPAVTDPYGIEPMNNRSAANLRKKAS